MSEHTPTPWGLGSHNLRAVTKEAQDIADGCDHYMVAVTSAHSLVSQAEATANAAFIVQAVNNHDRLVALAKAVECEFYDSKFPHSVEGRLRDQARSILTDLISLPRHT